MSKANPDAIMLARQFHDVYEKLAPQFGYETRQDTKQFDPNSSNGQLMTSTIQTLLAEGRIVIPQYHGAVRLKAIRDGRRSRQRHPDELLAWQFLGAINEVGKPHSDAPRWAAERIKRDPNGEVVLKSTRCLLVQPLLTGDWVVRDTSLPGDPRIYSITAAEVARWYTIQD